MKHWLHGWPTILRERLVIVCLIAVAPVLWLLFAHLPGLEGFYRPVENLALNWRFRARGQLETPEVKIIYANIDASTINEWGERPWARHTYATFIESLFELTGVRAVGVDMVLAASSYSELVDLQAVQESDRRLGNVVAANPGLVLAGNFTGEHMPLTLEQRAVDQSERALLLTERDFPYLGSGVSPAATFPSIPGFPIMLPEQAMAGQVGLIDWNSGRNEDPSPRWVPMFADTKGSSFFLSHLDSVLQHYGIPREHFGMPETPAQEEAFMQYGFYTHDFGQVTPFLPGFQPLPPLEPFEVEHRFYHFSLELALRYLGLDHQAVRIDDDRLRVTRPDGTVAIEAPLTDGQEIEINWFSKWHDTEAGALMENPYNPQESIAYIRQQMVNFKFGEGETKAQAERFLANFDNAIVLIGPEDALLQDLAPTPFDDNEVPKVSLHGNAIKTLLTGEYLQRTGTGMEVLVTLLLTPVVAGLAVYTGRYSLWAKAGSLLLVSTYMGVVFGAFAQAHLILPLVVPLGSAGTAATMGVLYQLLVEERQRSRIKGMFGTYLSPELVDRMVESGEEPRLGGEQVEITAFFSDVQSFSTFSELLRPEQLVQLMNEYLGAMTEILEAKGGTLDKYIGDAIVALFNAPVPIQHHAMHACKAAAMMQQRQADLRARWAEQGHRWPSVVPLMQTRIGLNTGLATVGNMGSEKRFNYTMMGDTVNLAARCESGAKAYGVYTMLTAETRTACEAASAECLFRKLDKVQVKGRHKPAEMHELIGLREQVGKDTLTCLEIYETGLEHYFEQRFSLAADCFERSLLLEPNRPELNPQSPTTPSAVMLPRARHYMNRPPAADWDGVFVMKTK